MAWIASLDLPRHRISVGFAPSISVTLLQVEEISDPLQFIQSHPEIPIYFSYLSHSS